MKTEGAKRSSWAQGEINEFCKKKPTATELVGFIKFIDRWDKNMAVHRARLAEVFAKGEWCKLSPEQQRRVELMREGSRLPPSNEIIGCAA